MRKANCVAKKSDIFVVGHSCLGNRHSSDGSELQMRRWSCVVLPSHALCRTVDPLLLVGGSNSVTDTIQELTRSLFLNKPALFVYLDLVKDALHNSNNILCTTLSHYIALDEACFVKKKPVADVACKRSATANLSIMIDYDTLPSWDKKMFGIEMLPIWI